MPSGVLKFNEFHSVERPGSISHHSGTRNPVYKRGAVTGATTGTVSHIKLELNMDRWPSNVPNQSYVVFPNASFLPVARRGDSGAWPLDEDGQLLGIIHGGDEARGSGFVIPIHDVLEDIQRITGFNADLNLQP